MIIFLFKNVSFMHAYVDLVLEGRKKLWGRDFYEQKFVREGLQKTNNLFSP